MEMDGLVIDRCLYWELFDYLFVCFKGRIESLPDELNPYLQSSNDSTNERGGH